MPPLRVITEHQAELCAVEQLPTSYLFIHGSIRMSVTISQFLSVLTLMFPLIKDIEFHRAILDFSN